MYLFISENHRASCQFLEEILAAKPKTEYHPAQSLVFSFFFGLFNPMASFFFKSRCV
jgi:hypothetical protein